MEEMTIKEIVCGSNYENCRGLAGIVEDYVKSIHLDEETEHRISEYITLIKNRANGKILTAAEYLRRYVQEHPLYKFDSNINESIARDVIDLVVGIAHGKVKAPELLGEGVDISERTKDNKNSCDALDGCHSRQGMLLSRL